MRNKGSRIAWALLLGLLLNNQGAMAKKKFETARAAVRGMGVGWNLGNTLDSNSGDVNNMWIEHNTRRTPKDYETAWGQPSTRPELIRMMAKAGFRAIRVPVTWYPHTQEGRIDSAWMRRVHEVVDYVIDAGLYCILNVHHDTGEASTVWLRADTVCYATQRERFEAIWRQVATEFRNYGDRLLFEGYNEMLDPYGSWCFASFATPNHYDAGVARSAYQAVNRFAQSFVDVVRSTGGGNARRNLIVSPYGACSGAGNWNPHLTEPLQAMQLPHDPAGRNHLIFELHAYPSVKDLAHAKAEVEQMMRDAHDILEAKGAPVIYGEWGSSESDAYARHRDNKIAFCRYFAEQAREHGFATFYWMGLSDGRHRSVPEVNEPELLEAIMAGYYGEGRKP